MRLRTVLFSALAVTVVATTIFGAPAQAGPRLGWAQLQIPLGRLPCTDRAKRAMRAVYRWRLQTMQPDEQHVFAETKQISGWIRCWEINTPSGPQSIVTIMVAGNKVKLVDRLRSNLSKFMRQGGF